MSSNNPNQAAAFTITNTRLYVLVLTLWTQNNVKLLQKLKSGFKRTINLNEYQSKVKIQRHNQYLDYLTDPSLQEVNRFFVFFISRWILNKLQTIFSSISRNKRLQCMINGQKVFDHPLKII